MVVLARSYSRQTGETSCESETWAVGQRVADRLGGAALVVAVEIGEEAADGDRHVLAGECGQPFLRARSSSSLSSGSDLAAMGVEAAADAEAVAARTSGFGFCQCRS